MKKTIRFQTRFLSLKNQGEGRVALDVYNTLKDEYDIIKCTAKSSSNLGYLKHFLFDNIFKSRIYDFGIAITNLDVFYLNPKKSLVIIHDLIPITDAFTIKTHYTGGLLQKLVLQYVFYYSLYKASKFKKIVFISEETKTQFINLFPKTPKENMQVIYNKFPNKYSYQERIVKNKFRLYYVGVLDNRKRLIEFLKIFMKIKNPNYEFIIGGSGTLTEEIKEIMKTDNRIKMLGFVKEEDMLKRYSECDVFIFPTKVEGFGMPIIEASLCYRPVITFNDGNIPDVVKKSTLSIYKDELKRTLEQLSQDNSYWNYIARKCYLNSMSIIMNSNKQKTIKQLIEEIK